MRAVAERFVFRMPTAAQADCSAAREVKLCSRGVADFKLALDANGAVVVDRDLSCHLFDGSKLRSKSAVLVNTFFEDAIDQILAVATRFARAGKKRRFHTA